MASAEATADDFAVSQLPQVDEEGSSGGHLNHHAVSRFASRVPPLRRQKRDQASAEALVLSLSGRRGELLQIIQSYCFSQRFHHLLTAARVSGREYAHSMSRLKIKKR